MRRTALAALLAGSLTLPAITGGTTLAANPSRTVRTVAMINRAGKYAYSPKTVTIRLGTTITFRNRSSAPHTVSTTGKYRAFDSGVKRLIRPHAKWSFTFRRRGRFAYTCLLHPYMKGTVIVR